MSPLPTTNPETNAPNTRALSWIVFIGALFFIGLGVAYWIHSKDSLTDCIFGRADCSNAAATWTLLVATVCAFIAAYEAAMKAGAALRVSTQAFNIETEPMLGQWLCTNEEGHKAPRAIVFIEDHTVSLSMPRIYAKDRFVPLYFDFENLGRTALREVTVTLHLEWLPEDDENGKTFDQAIPLGSIGAHRDAHVSIFLLWDFPTRPKIGWLPDATIRERDEEANTYKLVPLPFSPYPMVLVEAQLPPHEPADGNAPPADTHGAKQIGSKVGDAKEHAEAPKIQKTQGVSEPPKDTRRWEITTDDTAANKKADDARPASSRDAKRSGSTVKEDREIQ